MLNNVTYGLFVQSYEDHRRKWDTEEYQKLADERLQQEYDKTESKILHGNQWGFVKYLVLVDEFAVRNERWYPCYTEENNWHFLELLMLQEKY